MLIRVKRPRVALVLCLLAGCATILPPLDQRTSQGPTADEFWTARVMQQTGRAPSFEEKRHFENEMDERIGRYLREHQDAASSTTVLSFRSLRQVTIGMDKQQVEILLGPPITTTRDPAQMQNFARHHWPEIRDKTKPDEAWSYPFGWVVYFSRSRVADITQYLPRT
jgi:outer membrane protein assembly factor BamE (lipoprotein component of BamABCDE complex)